MGSFESLEGVDLRYEQLERSTDADEDNGASTRRLVLLFCPYHDDCLLS